MKRILQTFFIVLVAGSVTRAQTTVNTFQFEGNLRSYRTYVPASYSSSSSHALVLNLHGYTSNAAEQELYTQFNQVADTAGCIVVYPDGVNEAWNSGFNVPYNSGINDVGFLNALIDTISSHFNIDSERIFSTGMSNGGFMSFRLACELSNRIAAIASVTGLMSTGQALNCNPASPVPVMLVHGTADGTVLYTGASYHLSADSTVGYWRNQLNCPTSPSYLSYPNTNTTDGCTAENYRWVNCTDQSEVNFIRINGGGHTWPGAPVDVGVTNHDISATGEIWKFFLRHSPTTQPTAIRTVGAEKFLIYPQPASEVCTIELVANKSTRWVLSDITNSIVAEGNTNDAIVRIDVRNLSNGVYFFISDSGHSLTTKKMVVNH